jgi:hypothetical protein
MSTSGWFDLVWFLVRFLLLQVLLLFLGYIVAMVAAEYLRVHAHVHVCDVV